MSDICIIGGGAAGMTAAICAKEQNQELDIVILEKKSQPGKKILASGNGKCNLSNTNCEDYRETLNFFQRLGVITRVDGEGRIYPYTEEAVTVRDALVRKIDALGISLFTEVKVTAVERQEKAFAVKTSAGDFAAGKVLIACGGKSGPAFGTTGDGYKWARDLGHKVRKPIPALTAVDVKEDVSSLAGVRAKGRVRLKHSDKEIFEESGEIQFTKTGLSGICVFNLSSFLLIPDGKTVDNGFDDYRIYVDFFPKGGDIEGMLRDRESGGFHGKDLLKFLVRDPIAEEIYARSGGDVHEAAKLLRGFVFAPHKVKGWDFAQVTKGGVSLDEIDAETMESKLVSGLFFAGEITDYDGPCGGYNLQNAWRTGIKAGRAMA